MSELLNDLDFPIWGLLPKKETNVTSFQTKHPEYDGRDTIIAIFDSGVDPGAPGLQKTSTGKVKVIHRFDCSGCGDVDTTTIVQGTNSQITGLTGRRLKIPSAWKNPSNEYRIGVKHAFDLYPERLEERVASKYKTEHWDPNHRESVANATRLLHEFSAKHEGNNLPESQKLVKEDLEAKVEFLNGQEKKFADKGPVFDCVLFHDGDKWVCCVDTTETGDLDRCPLLGEYCVTHEYAPLTKADHLNFSMNVHDGGDVLELVGLCSNHGTHVASIASAYFPDCPEECGVAPGAQIASFTIGDGRLGSMETGTAIVRAIIKLMEISKRNQIHVINMSYGEHSHFSDSGRIGELMSEVVNKYGVVWVASAGNHGPALSTVSTPPDINQETIIGVGAYVSPDMMVAAYSMRQKLPGMPFTWSSRGPCTDGGMGVSICAPGGAVTSVPNCTLRYSQLMNGTSMAAPHVAGAVSTLISGLIANNIKYSPYSIKRALENGATLLKDVEVFAQGNGLLNVDKSYDFLINYQGIMEANVRFHITCGPINGKGIYLRSAANRPQSLSVAVEPNFLDTDNVPAEMKLRFNMKLALVCNADYVSCPTHLDISNGSRVFAVKIDPTSLASGVYATWIEAFDIKCVAKGPVFKIPITVIQPQLVTAPKHVICHNSVLFKPNTTKRDFVVVPHFATWALLRVSCLDANSVGRFIVHAMHILPKQNCKTLEYNKAITISSNADTVVSFQVRSNAVLELAIAKYWASLGEMNLDYTLSFYGVKPNEQSATMHAADGVHSLELTCLQGEEILPVITLRNSVQILKPSDGKVAPLTKRDVIPPNRQIYQLILTYSFTLTKSTEVSPNLALLSDVLYESEFESQLWLLFDSNKQLISCGDAYPSKYTIKIEKGDYVIKLLIRHEKKEYLDKMTEVPMLLQQKLSTAINLDVYSSYSQAVICGKKSTGTHGLHSTVPFYIAPLPQDKFVAKSNNPAHFLTGSITYCKEELGKKVDIYPFKYILLDSAAKKSTNANGNTSEKSKYEEGMDAVRDLKTQLLTKLDFASGEKFYKELLEEYPEHLPVRISYLQVVDPLDVKRAFPPLKSNDIGSVKAIEVLLVCGDIEKKIDQDALLAYFAIKTDLRSDASKIKSNMDQQKTVFTECLSRKGINTCRLYIAEKDAKTAQTHLETIKDIWQTLAKFVDVTDPKIVTSHVLYFAVWHARVLEQYGRLLKYAWRLYEEKPGKELEEKIIELSKINGWDYLALHLTRNIPSKYPTGYRLF